MSEANNPQVLNLDQVTVAANLFNTHPALRSQLLGLEAAVDATNDPAFIGDFNAFASKLIDFCARGVIPAE